MIDLFLWSANAQTLVAFARANGLQVRVGDVIDNDPDSPTFGQVIVQGEWQTRDGLEWAWWAGSRQFMVSPPVLDVLGVVTTPATYNGVAAHMRIHAGFFAQDRLIPDEVDPDRAEAWARSKVARFIKNNGTPGQRAGVQYYELDGVQLSRVSDIQEWCEGRGVPGHSYL